MKRTESELRAAIGDHFAAHYPNAARTLRRLAKQETHRIPMRTLYRIATIEPAIMPGTMTPSSIFDPGHRQEHKGIEFTEDAIGVWVHRGPHVERVPWSNIRVASYRAADAAKGK